MNNQYEVLSPWSDVDPAPLKGLKPRETDLNGKKIGLFSFFKWHGPIIMKELGQKLKERFPTAEFSEFHYPVEDVEITKDDEYKAKFEEWVKGVDTVVTAIGD